MDWCELENGDAALTVIQTKKTADLDGSRPSVADRRTEDGKAKTHKIPAIEIENIGVAAFGAFTHDLHDLACYYKSHDVTKVAIKSTGAY
jgi:hypothetical protein